MSLIPVFPTLIPGILPPSKETWELSGTMMKYFPVAASLQLLVPFFGMGKHSKESRFNLPGKFAWVTMEIPTLIVGGYVANTVPALLGLPGGFNDLPGTNKLIIALFMLHYINRALITPILLTPSIAPIHVGVWASAVAHNVFNGMSICGWAAGYGVLRHSEWAGSRERIQIGLMIFCLGLFSNVLHEDELREIRRRAAWEQEQKERKAKEKGEAKDGAKAGERVYKIPQALGFQWVLYPHYLSEWVEWAGFWLIGGLNFVPGRSFLIGLLVAMGCQAWYGKKWYLTKFGKENVGDKKAVIPFLF